MGSKQAWDLETELVIVGAGGCGMMAAFAAASRGIELIVLEKNAKLGSNTELASGSIAAAGTRFQQALGITGSAEEMAADVMRKNGGQADPEIVLTLCRKAREVIEVLDGEVGLPLTFNTDAGRVGHSFLRMHNPPGRTGEPIIAALKAVLERFPNATFADRTPGVGLITDPDGAVIGVRAGPDGEQRIGAKKVILACDGFGANKAMLREYIPDMADAEYIGGAGNTGDGIRWGIEIGAAVAHMTGHQGHGYVCKGYGSRLSAEIPLMGGIMVNVDGDRFVHEDQGYSEFARVVLAQPGGVCYEIFDQRIHDILIKTAHFKEAADSGALRRGDTIEDLARALKLDPGRVRAAFDDYNASRDKGEDRFGRKLFGEPLRPPFYGAMLTGALAHTQGGLVVDVHARVLREDRSIIPNLYAGGGTAAGVSGNGPEGYLSGNGLLTAFGFGLIAAEHAAATIRGQ